MALTYKVFSLAHLKMLVVAASIFFVFNCHPSNAQESKDQSENLASVERLIDERNFEKAYDLAKTLALTDPHDAKTWFYYGVSSLELQHLKEGTEALRKSIKLDSGYAAAHTFLANALLRQGALPEALIEADAALQISSTDSYANYTRAFINFQQNQMEDAARYSEIAYLGKPDFADAYLLRAQALIGRYQISRDADETVKQKSRYASAADALSRYVELASPSNSRTIWFDQIELLRSFPFEDNNLPKKQFDKRVQILEKPEPSYSEEARRYQIRGTVILRALFDVDGTVKKIFVCQSLRGGLTENSVKAAAKIKFVPATANGQTVSTWMQLEYNFSLF